MEKAHDSDEGEAVGLQQIHAACVLHEAYVPPAGFHGAPLPSSPSGSYLAAASI
jgi:hypothetical protein